MKLFACLRPLPRHLARHFSSDKAAPWPKRIFSGIQPTGNMHLGNYFGAVKKWIDMQNNKEDLILSVVDLHSITLPQNPEALRSGIMNMIATLLACGIDHNKCILFQQSTVSQHAELSWILGTLITTVRLEHLAQYKEKTAGMKEIPLGLLIYPVLQAADILLYKATHVPVGKDQMQQIEVAHKVQRTFNHRFGKTFPYPTVLTDNFGGRIKSLRDPLKKMSKSDPQPLAKIDLIDPPDVLLNKVKKAVTDFTSRVTFEPEQRPGVANLLEIHSLFTGKSSEDICQEYINLDTGQYKLKLAEIVIESLSPIRKKVIELLDSPEFLVSVLNTGKEKASDIAHNTMEEVKDKVGFGVNVSCLQNICKVGGV